MASSSSLKLNWLDHFDSTWVNEDPEAIVTRKGVVCLFDKLLSNKEAVTIPQAPLQLRGPLLPEFERAATQNEQDQFLNDLLSSQLTLARLVSSDSPFYSTLRRRLAILQRIFCALSGKFHNKGKQNLLLGANLNSNDQSKGKSKATDVKCGKNVLIEMGIKTGLSLLFSLLRQSWQNGQEIICNDVLATACSVLSSLPPLSLSQDSKIPELGTETLRQVSEFLISTASVQSAADTNGRRLACELLLRIGVHRGSLKCILEWIEMAIVMDCGKPEDRPKNTPIVGISVDCLEDMCQQMRKLMVR